MKKKFWVLAALAVFCAGTAFAAKDTLDDRMVANPTTFDPFATADISTQKIHYQLFDSLMHDNVYEHKIEPNVCTKYETKDGGYTLVFTIRNDVKFHDGSLMTPEDVVFSINTAVASPFTKKVSSNIKNAELLPDNTVAVHLVAPMSGTISAFASSNLSIVPKKIYEADPKAFGKKPVGSGPFKLDSVKTGETVVLTAFDDYFKGVARIKKITYHVITDNSTAIMALEAGDLDICQPSQDFSDRQAIIDNPDLKYYEDPQPCFFHLCFNTEGPLMKNKKLRQAIVRAVDTEELIIGAVNGVAYENAAPMSTQSIHYPKGFKPIPYDLEAAKKLLAEAGYPNGLDLKIRVIAATNYSKPAEIIQAQLKKIGINVTVETMERATWNEQVYAGGQYDASFWAHAITVLDGDYALYPFFHSSQANGAGANMYNYKNKEVDELLEKARYEQDNEKRIAIYRDVCEKINDDAVLLPCYGVYRTMAANAKLKGVVADGMSRYQAYGYSWE